MQILKMQQKREFLILKPSQQLKQNKGTPLWDKIDYEINTITPIQQNKMLQNKEYAEINTLTPIQQNKMLQNKEYAEVNTKLQGLVWS